MKVWFNGQILDERRAALSVFDHAFLYGDGLYETVRLSSGTISLWQAHFSRFKKGAHHYRYGFPWSSNSLEKAVLALAKANARSSATVRLTLSRGAGPLGLDPALCPIPTLVIQLHPDRDLQALRAKGVSIGIVSIQRSFKESLDPYFKSTSMQQLVLAKMQAKRLGVFEGILLNAKKEVTEGITSNLFLVRRHMLSTPSIACGLLPGVTRAHVLQLARRESLRVREARLTVNHLAQADELFLTNASFEIMPVSLLKLNGRIKRLPGPQGPLVQRLQHAWRQSD